MHLFWCGSSSNSILSLQWCCIPLSPILITTLRKLLNENWKNSFLKNLILEKKVLVDTFRIPAYSKLCLFRYDQAYSALLTIFRMEREVWRKGKTPPSTSLFTVTYTYKGINLWTSWLLALTIFLWNEISSPCLIIVPNYWTWTTEHSSKQQFFWPNPNKAEIMITSLIWVTWKNFLMTS